jgi:hypothetical protein
MYMSYTDEDILDLYNHLHEVGLAEEPYEAVERIRQEIRPIYSRSLTPTRDVISLLLDRNIHHTYVLTLRVNPITKSVTTTAFPLIRGHVLCLSEVLPLDSFIQMYSPKVLDLRQCEDLESMKQTLLEFKVNYPTVNLDKYHYLP